MSRDPLDYGPGDTNLYEYVHGNPVNLIDPMGLDKITSWFNWLYWRSLWFDNYQLARLTVEADYSCARGDVNITRLPTLVKQEVNYGVAGVLGVPVIAPYTCKSGGRGFSVQMSAASSYSASGFWSTAGTYAGAGAGGGALIGAGITWYTGPGVLAGAGAGGAIGGAGGFIVGAGAWLADFSSWNSPITINYTVCCCSCGTKVWTLNESAGIPGTGNSDVSAIASTKVYWCNKQANWNWGLNMSAADVAKGGPNSGWKQANISPKHGLNFAETFVKPR